MVEAGVRGFKGFMVEAGTDDFKMVAMRDIEVAYQTLVGKNTVLMASICTFFVAKAVFLSLKNFV